MTHVDGRVLGPADRTPSRPRSRRPGAGGEWQRGEVHLPRGATVRLGAASCAAGPGQGLLDTAAGTEVVLAVRGPGALLGELSAVDRRAASATVHRAGAGDRAGRAARRLRGLPAGPRPGRVAAHADARSAGCATPTASGSSSARTTPPAGWRPGWSSWRSGSAQPADGRACGSRCRCRRTSWPAGPARPARRSARRCGALRDGGLDPDRPPARDRPRPRRIERPRSIAEAHPCFDPCTYAHTRWLIFIGHRTT